MCASPIQYSRDFIIEIKEGKKSNITQNKTLINTLINEYFLANLKIIEKNAVDNMPTHNNYKGNKGNYGKKKTKYLLNLILII